MRMFKPRFGPPVDLDDPQTYAYLPDDINELDKLMLKEIGYALLYMNYFPTRKNLFDKDNIQRMRVEELINYFALNRSRNISNKDWYKEQIFLLQDETENMC